MNISKFLKKYWPAIAIILIFTMAFNTRLVDYRWDYLRNIDSYLMYRMMDETVQNNGIIQSFDPLTYAPHGRDRGVMHPYIYAGAYSYMFIKLFLPGLELWQYLIYFPAFLAAFMAIPMYYIGKTLYDRKAGVLAAFFIVFDISIMSRTLGGDPDTDAIALLTPLIVMALFLVTYKYIDLKKTLDKRALFYSFITGIALGLWAFIWSGNWYIIWLITGFIFVKIIINFLLKLENKRNIMKMLISYAIMILVLFTITIPFMGPGFVIVTIVGPLKFGELKSEEMRIFPNVYVSVAELQISGGPPEIIGRTSVLDQPANIFSPFFLLLFSLIYLFYSSVKKRKHIDTMLLLLIWFIGPFMATMGAVRFSILFSAPMAIGAGIILSKLLRMVSNEDEKVED